MLDWLKKTYTEILENQEAIMRKLDLIEKSIADTSSFASSNVASLAKDITEMQEKLIEIRYGV